MSDEGATAEPTVGEAQRERPMDDGATAEPTVGEAQRERPVHTVNPSHLGLCVADLEQSMRFYCDGLGFEAAEVYDLDEQMLNGLDRALEVSPPVKLRSQMIKNGDLKIELLHYTEPKATGSPSTSRGRIGFTHLSFFVADVDDAAAKLATLGGTVLADTRSRLGYEVVFVADPDGARIELMAPPRQ